MSRKRSRSSKDRSAHQGQTAVQKKLALITKPQAVAEILSALDGYSNAAAFLGDNRLRTSYSIQLMSAEDSLPKRAM